VEFNAHIYPIDAINNELASLTQRRSGVRAPLRPLGNPQKWGFLLLWGYASADGTLMLWELVSGRVIHTLTGHSSWVNDVALMPDNRQAISASHDQSLSVWDLEKRL
jgi:WD40 repeat protein